MSDENKPLGAPDAQDTRTRKTVKLRSSAPITQDIPVADPLTSRDTDTGNLEILDDTQTRKTLKLKPMTAGTPAPGPKLDLGDTNTRKTVVLRPSGVAGAPVVPQIPKPGVSIPGGVSVAAPVNPVPASAVAAPKVEIDDQTAAVPRPSAAPAAPKVEVDDQTAAVPRPSAGAATVKLPGAAPAAAEDDDQTVKLKRPPRLTPSPVPGAATRPPMGGDLKATVKLPARPGAPATAAPAAAPAAAPKPPTAAPKPPTAAPQPPTAAPKPPTAAPKPPTATLQAPDAPAEKEKKSNDDEISLAPSEKHKEPSAEEEKGTADKTTPKTRNFADADEADKPSLAYLVLAVLTLLFVAAAGVITTVHYLDFEQKIQIYEHVPFLPVAK